jgi:hypothetical protein
MEQVASGGAEHREEHDCPLHQGPEGQAAYHIEGRELSRTSEAYAYDARQPVAKGGRWLTRFGIWRIPDGSAQNCGSRWSGLHPASGRVGRRLAAGMRSLVDKRMRLTGQNGVSDYGLGFTNVLSTFETSAIAQACRTGQGGQHLRLPFPLASIDARRLFELFHASTTAYFNAARNALNHHFGASAGS